MNPERHYAVRVQEDDLAAQMRKTGADLTRGTEETGSPVTPYGLRAWISVITLGFVGQLAWTIENMYLNVFVYNTITENPDVIAALVASSAIAATLAAMFMGALSDRVGRRKPFIVIGYILWGLTTAAFGLIRVGVVPGHSPTAQAVMLAIIAVIVLDCIMSIFGATANDAAFNAWVTDTTDPTNRGRVDGVLAVMPPLSMLVVFGLLDGLTQDGRWDTFFILVGGIIVLIGIAAIFFVKESHPTPQKDKHYIQDVLYGLRPTTFRQYPRLYWLLTAASIIGIGSQVFIPYLIIYMQAFLRLDTYPIILAVVLTLASVASVLGGRLIDRFGKLNVILPAALTMIVGLVAMFFVRDMVGVMLAGTIMMSGFLISTAAIAASIRDVTPASRVGMVQGLRMIFVVLIPMVVGPFIGARVISNANETYEELGVLKQVPTPWIFIAGAVVVLFVVIPVVRLYRMAKVSAK